MSRGGPTAVGRALRWLRPPPRLVDWSIFTAVMLATASGVFSFLGVRPAWVPVFWFHRVVGLTLIVLLAFKLSRVRYRLTRTSQWQASTALSIATALAAFGTIGTGIMWVFGYVPELPLIQFLTVHVAFGLVLVVLMVAHQRTRFRAPRRVDFDRRRTTMQYSVMLVAGAATYRLQEAGNTAPDTPRGGRAHTGGRRQKRAGDRGCPPPRARGRGGAPGGSPAGSGRRPGPGDPRASVRSCRVRVAAVADGLVGRGPAPTARGHGPARPEGVMRVPGK